MMIDGRIVHVSELRFREVVADCIRGRYGGNAYRFAAGVATGRIAVYRVSCPECGGSGVIEYRMEFGEPVRERAGTT